MKRYAMLSLLLAGTLLGVTTRAASPSPVVDSAIQAIQQAPEPSAAVAAYANALALERTQPKIYEAYVARMVKFGLPELAYHQARTLTELNASSGLAWGVIAHVDARRGDMPAAIAAIDLAGANAPDNQFIQRTAGELLAWYDTQADKAKLPDPAKAGLDKIRSLLAERPDYIAAYDAAKQAYQTSATLPTQGTTLYPAQPSTAPEAYGSPTPGDANTPPQTLLSYPEYPADSYPYAYDYGPGWAAPAPWWWWQPAGFFAGFDFFPFPSVFVFHGHDFFSHHHGFFHDHDGQSFAHGRFFGTSVRANAAFARLNHGHFVSGSSFRVNRLGVAQFHGSLGAIPSSPSFATRSHVIQGFPPGLGIRAGSRPSRMFTPAPRLGGPRFGGMGAQHFAMHRGGGFPGTMGGFPGMMGGLQGTMGGFHGGGFHGGGRR